MLQPIQRGVESPLLDLQRPAGDLLDAKQDAVAMELAERDCLEDQEIQRPREYSCLICHVFSYIT
jgi:hypothetical protein